MSTTELRGKLHEYIDTADDRHIEAIYLLLEQAISANHTYDAETMQQLHERRCNHLEGKSKSYTPEETWAYVRATGK